MEYQRLNKNARKVMYITTSITSLISGTGLIIAYNFIEKNQFLTTSLIIIEILIVLNLIISPHFRYERYKYSIDDDKIEVIQGYIWIKRTIVPIGRIHKITLSSGPIDNLFNLTKVIVTTAGGEGTIKFLETEKADLIAKQLKNEINIIAKEESDTSNDY